MDLESRGLVDSLGASAGIPFPKTEIGWQSRQQLQGQSIPVHPPTWRAVDSKRTDQRRSERAPGHSLCCSKWQRVSMPSKMRECCHQLLERNPVRNNTLFCVCPKSNYHRRFADLKSLSVRVTGNNRLRKVNGGCAPSPKATLSKLRTQGWSSHCFLTGVSRHLRNTASSREHLFLLRPSLFS